MKKNYLIAIAFVVGLLSWSATANGQNLLSEDFTSATGTTPPTGWVDNDISGSGMSWSFDNPGGETLNAPITAPFAAFDSDYYGGGSPSGENSALESVAFDASGITNTIILSFDQYFDGGWGGEYHVEVFNGSSWVEVLSDISGNETANPDHQSIDITTALAGAVNAQVRFRWVGDYSYYWFVDNVSVDAISCLPVTALTLTGLSENTADISWTAGGGETAWNIEWGVPGFTPGTGAEIGSDTPGAATYQITGLTPNTSYDVYVQADCGGGDVATWAGPFTITTSCSATNVPYIQDFESATLPNMPACTSIENAGSGNNWQTANINNSGFNSNVLNYSYNSSNPADTWFYTQGINLTAGTYYQISYDYSDYNFVENLKVAYGASPSSASMTNLISDDATAGTSTLASKLITFTPPTTGVYYFGFNAHSAANMNQLYVDNISIDVAPSCPQVSGLTKDAATNTTADISWTAGATESAWNIQWGVPGFTPGTGAEIGSDTPGTAAYQITGLTVNTGYDVYVQADCGGGDESIWVGPLYIYSGYCVPTSVGNTSNYISGVSTVNAIQNLNNTGTGLGPNGYGDYTATDTLIVYPGQTIDFTFTHPSSTYTYSTWIDWNGNFDFTDAGDQIINSGYQSSPFTISYTVPGTAPISTTRLRIRNSFYGNPISPCGDLNYSEAEDYIIKIIAAPSCLPVTNLVLGAVTENTAGIAWTAGGSESSWNIEWGTPGFTPGTGAEIGSDTYGSSIYTINGLSPNTTYDVYVQADCGGGLATWAGPLSVTTGQIPVSTFPYIQDWETGGTDWTISNGTQTNQWAIGSAIANGGTQSIYVSNDGGTSYNYNTNSISASFAYRDFAFPTSAPELKLQFDWQSVGESYGWDKLRVYITPVSFIPTPGTQITPSGSGPTGIVQLGNDFDSNNSFTTENITIPIVYAGTNARIILEWSNDGSGGSNPPAAVDNFGVNVLTCPDVTGLVVNGAGIDSLQILWIAGTYASSWNLEWGTPGFTPGTGTEVGSTSTSDSTYTITGLNPSSDYDIYVQSDCGGGDSSSWTLVQGITLCGVITNLPWTYNFDGMSTVGYGIYPNCWVDESGDFYTDPGTYTTSLSAPNNVSIDWGSDDYLWTPEFNLVAGTTYEFSFHWIGDGYDGWNGGVYYSGTQSSLDAVQLGVNFIDDATTTSTNYKKEVFCITPDTSGVYSFGLHVSSNYNPYTISFDNFSLLVPASNAGMSGASTVCQTGGLVDLNSIVTINDTTGTWTFNQNPNAIENDTLFNPAYIPSGTANVYYIVGGCLPDSATAAITIAPPSNAGIDGTVSTCNFGVLNLFDGLTGNVDLGGQWYDPNNQPINGTTVNFNGQVAASYNYTYVVSNGVCPADSSIIEVQLQDCAGLDEYSLKGFVLYPNPTNGLVNIQYSGEGEDVKLNVVDAVGKIVYSQQVQFNDGMTKAIDMSALESGIYYINMTAKEGRSVMKVVKN